MKRKFLLGIAASIIILMSVPVKSSMADPLTVLGAAASIAGLVYGVATNTDDSEPPKVSLSIKMEDDGDGFHVGDTAKINVIADVYTGMAGHKAWLYLQVYTGSSGSPLTKGVALEGGHRGEIGYSWPIELEEEGEQGVTAQASIEGYCECGYTDDLSSSKLANVFEGIGLAAFWLFGVDRKVKDAASTSDDFIIQSPVALDKIEPNPNAIDHGGETEDKSSINNLSMKDLQTFIEIVSSDNLEGNVCKNSDPKTLAKAETSELTCKRTHGGLIHTVESADDEEEQGEFNEMIKVAMKLANGEVWTGGNKKEELESSKYTVKIIHPRESIGQRIMDIFGPGALIPIENKTGTDGILNVTIGKAYVNEPVEFGIEVIESPVQDPETDELRYSWDFGTGKIFEGKSGETIFNQTGLFEGSLTIDLMNRESMETTTLEQLRIMVSVHSRNPHIISLIANSNEVPTFLENNTITSIGEARAGEQVFFDLTLDNHTSGDMNIAMHFGDENKYTTILSESLEARIQHTFDKPGLYWYILSVHDRYGGSASKDGIIHILGEYPKASVTINNSSAHFHGSIADAIVFDASDSIDSDGGIVNYVWHFGDGTADYGKTVSHFYNQTGTYSGNLTVMDDNYQSTIIDFEIEIRDVELQIDMDSTPIGGVQMFSAMAYHPNAPPADPQNYLWDFGDGNSGSGFIVQHEYSSAGSYLVSLTVSNDEGEKVSISRTINVDPGISNPIEILEPVAILSSEGTIDVSASLQNNFVQEKTVAYIVSIMNENNVAEFIGWQMHKLSPGEEIPVLINTGLPNGNYTVRSLVWNNMVASPVSYSEAKTAEYHQTNAQDYKVQIDILGLGEVHASAFVRITDPLSGNLLFDQWVENGVIVAGFPIIYLDRPLLLEVSKEGYEDFKSKIVGDSYRTIRLVAIEEEAKRVMLTVNVIDSSTNSPIPSALVRLESGVADYNLFTNETGTANGLVTLGQYSVTVGKEKYESLVLDLMLDEDEQLTVEISPVGDRIEIDFSIHEFSYTDPAPVPGALVRAWEMGTETILFEGVTGVDGKYLGAFSADDPIYPLTLVYEVSKEGYETSRAQLEVPAREWSIGLVLFREEPAQVTEIFVDSMGAEYEHFDGFTEVYGQARIIDDSNEPIPDASVSFELRYLEDNSVQDITIPTDPQGTAFATFQIEVHGVYSLTVTEVTANDMTYNPAKNMQTSITISIE